jgi:FixJ family two-component response regulator
VATISRAAAETKENVGMSANLISIVDDDEAAREAVVGLVRVLGFAAAAFRSAAEFLKSGCLLRTDCLIADMQMPGMTGFELYRHLVAAGQSIPTILVTAYPDEAVRAFALSAGVRCYLAKPLEPDALLGCIRSAFVNPTGGRI